MSDRFSEHQPALKLREVLKQFPDIRLAALFGSIALDILPHLYRWGIPLQSARGQLITRLAGSCC